MRGDRVGFVGPNGAGGLALVILDQRRETIDPDQSLSKAPTGGSGDAVTVAGQTRHVIGYMKDFLFRPEQGRTPGRRAVGRRACPAYPCPRFHSAIQPAGA